MGTFYEIVVTCCTPSRRSSVYCWLDYSALRDTTDTYSTASSSCACCAHCAYCACGASTASCDLGAFQFYAATAPLLTPAPVSPKASTTRTSFTSMPITLVATSTNRAEGDPTEPISDSAHNRRRRSRRRDIRRHRSRSRSRHRRPLTRRVLLPATEHRSAFPKAPPAVKAMPACRPAGLPRGR